MARKSAYIYSWDEVPVIIDVPYAAHLLGCSVNLIRKMCRSGQLKATKVGNEMWRITKADIMEYMGGVQV